MLLIVASGVYWANSQNRGSNAASALPRQSNRPVVEGAGYVASELATNQIFGDPGQGQKPGPPRVPLSSLNLRLAGVISIENGGFAMISVNGQPQAPFFAGEKIYQDTILESVLPDRVILFRSGARESLLLDPESNK